LRGIRRKHRARGEPEQDTAGSYESYLRHVAWVVAGRPGSGLIVAPVNPERALNVERRVRASEPERPCDDDTTWLRYWYPEARRRERRVDPNAKTAVAARAAAKREEEAEETKEDLVTAAIWAAAQVPARDDPSIRLPKELDELLAGAHESAVLQLEGVGPMDPDELRDADADTLRMTGEVDARIVLDYAVHDTFGQISAEQWATFTIGQVEAFVARYGREFVASFVAEQRRLR
jgi:hypothetical protein